MEFNEKQKMSVQNQLQIVGLLMEYHSRFGEYALEVSRLYFSHVGSTISKTIKKDIKITESDANAVAAVLDEYLMWRHDANLTIRIERNKVVMSNEGYCPVMEAVESINAPWELIDLSYNSPIFEGIAYGVNPNVRMDVTKRRYRGNKICEQVFTIPNR